ncbi:hypothetical protein [Bifidobacterium jacchi]|uniref:hypothetical protein n=1 Tax=Bifidobacterium jacchi TaxID=2490545 RepID=UPI00158820F0|nr:hypothetical protein [Bifidobacterium jacchi]
MNIGTMTDISGDAEAEIRDASSFVALPVMQLPIPWSITMFALPHVLSATLRRAFPFASWSAAAFT